MKVKVVNLGGEEKKTIELDDYVFNVKPNKTVIYEAIKNELANNRQGTASTKTKGEVSGSGAKPWKQKGTGRAQFGTKRNPVWRHGGVAHGPKPRDYSYKLPTKVKRLAYRSLLSLKLQNDDIVILDELKSEGKTQELRGNLDKVASKTKTSLILGASENDKMLLRAGKNLVDVYCLNFERMNVKSLYYSRKIVMTEEVALQLSEFLTKDKKEA